MIFHPILGAGSESAPKETCFPFYKESNAHEIAAGAEFGLTRFSLVRISTPGSRQNLVRNFGVWVGDHVRSLIESPYPPPPDLKTQLTKFF